MKKSISYDHILRSHDPDVDKLAKLFDAITRMYVTEYDNQLQLLQALGDDFEVDALRGPSHPAVNVKFITELDTAPAGTPVTAIAGLDAALACAGISKVYMGLNAGQNIPALTSSAARFGAVIASGATRPEAQTRARQAASAIRFTYAAS